MAAIEGLCKEAEVVMQRVAPLNDLILKSADGKEFAVSKAMLAAVSVMFANMFADLEGGVKTRGAKTDGDPLAIEEKGFEIVMLLNHVYAGSQYKITPKNIGTCLRLGVKYEVPGLMDACHAYLDNLELVVGNLPGWLAVAPGYGLARFTTRCVDFAAGNLQSIIDQRVVEKLPATDWLEKLQPSMLVEMMQLRTRILFPNSSYLVERTKPPSNEEIKQLEKRPRHF